MRRIRCLRAPLLVPVLAIAAGSGCGLEVPQPAEPAAQASPAAPTTAAPRPASAGVPLVPVDAPRIAEGNSAVVKCNIETLGGYLIDGMRPAVGATHAVEISGWYHVPGAPAAPLYLVVSSADASRQWVVQVPARTQRPDVATAQHDPAAIRSGFAFDLDLSALARGKYSMYLGDATRSSASICGMGHGFVVP